MKKLLATLFALLTPLAFAQNYNNGNGTILSEEAWGNLEIVRRRHVQTVTMAENLDIPEKNKALWADFSNLYETKYALVQEWGKPPIIDDCSGKVVHIKEILKVSGARDYPYYAYAVEVEGKKGYMYGEQCDFYDKGQWAVVGSIASSGRVWTIRTAKNSDNCYEIRERVFVRDKPGTKGTDKIYLFYKDAPLPDRSEYGTEIKVINATEEQETIDGRTGRWLEIEYKNIRGWVFEGYATREFFWGWTPEEVVTQLFTEGYR